MSIRARLDALERRRDKSNSSQRYAEYMRSVQVYHQKCIEWCDRVLSGKKPGAVRNAPAGLKQFPPERFSEAMVFQEACVQGWIDGRLPLGEYVPDCPEEMKRLADEFLETLVAAAILAHDVPSQLTATDIAAAGITSTECPQFERLIAERIEAKRLAAAVSV